MWAAQLSPASADAHADVFGAAIGADVLSLVGRGCLIGLSLSFFPVPFAIVVDPVAVGAKAAGSAEAVAAGLREAVASELEEAAVAPRPAETPLPPEPLPAPPLPPFSPLPPRSSILDCDLGCGFSGSIYKK